MTALVILAMALALGATAAAFVSYAIAHGRPVIRSIFHLDTPDEWPRGVQEEDPRPWRFPPGWGSRR